MKQMLAILKLQTIPTTWCAISVKYVEPALAKLKVGKEDINKRLTNGLIRISYSDDDQKRH